MAVYAALEGALWSAGAVQAVCVALTLALALGCTLVEFRSWRRLGLDPRSIRPSGWIIAVIGVAVGGVILGIAWRRGTLSMPTSADTALKNTLLNLLWALAQQFLAQSFFFLRFEQLLRSGRRAVIATALVFAGAHIPNPVLVPVTLVGGLILSEWFRRFRTLYPLAVAHALVALCLAISVPESVLHDMRVGIGYDRYRPTTAALHAPHTLRGTRLDHRDGGFRRSEA